MRSMEDFELSCVIFKIVLGWKRDGGISKKREIFEFDFFFTEKKWGCDERFLQQQQ
jgi:hypothetical protein